LAIVVVLSLSVAAEDRSAYVLDRRGHWKIESASTDLEKAAVVQEGSHIQHVATSPPGSQTDYQPDTIVLGGLWDIPKTFSCLKAERCVYEIVSEAHEHRASQIISAVMEIWRGKQSSDEGFSRGIQLREAVLGIHAAKLSLASMFSDAPPDTYHLRIRHIEDEKGTVKFTEINHSALFVWDPAHPVSLSIRDVKPGLYEVGLMSANATGDYDYIGISGWALACEAKLSWCKQSFGEAADLTNSWGDAVHPSVKRNFLRAYLQRLSVEAK
jgi:hypothetical protein